jgi:hypothetical protein
LFTKLFNNVTVRSNVFAVWATVGFFEVTDDTVRPVKLGAEIGRAENRQIRHRMFAIVDRTNMTASLNDQITTDSGQPMAPGVTQTLTVPGPFPDPRTGRSWLIQQGTVLVLEPNTDNEETVVLGAAVKPNQYPYQVLRPHPATTPVIIRGNPGPWLRYDPHQDSDVVKYFAVID